VTLLRIQNHFWRIAGCVFLVAGIGCRASLSPSKPLSELTAEESAGHRVFATRCGGCHEANSESALHGPGLFGLYRKQYLPSGAPANDDRVTWVILHGRGMMPAEGDSMDDGQLRALLAYLHTL
jgi:mono/diheme cytochrome c family protein